MFTTEDFFKILEYLRTGETNPDIPPEVRQLAQNTKLQTQQFFKNTLDQVSFNSTDYNRLRKLLIDWYASNKTFQDLGRNTTDAISLPHQMLDTACKGFGFDFATGIGGRIDKALFLYTLTELYKIKGSPRSIKTALEFFGIYDIQIFEWWLKKDPILDYLFFESSYVDLGGINPDTLLSQKIPYSHITLDPHWWYTESKIRTLNDTLPIRLPSITPYFSIQASASVDKLVQIYSIISRRISDQYTKFKDTGLLDKSIFVDIYGSGISLLELVLSIGYMFNVWTNRTHGSDSPSYIHYVGTEDDSDTIIDEYNNIVQRPTSRQDQMDRIEQFNNKFTKLQSGNFLQSAIDTPTKLEEVNPIFKSWVDSKLTSDDMILEVLKELLRELDIYVKMELGVQALSFSNMMLGTDADDILNVINFFKPKRARLLAFNLVYAVDDPLFNSILLADTLYNRIRQWDQEECDVVDRLVHTKITQWDYDAIVKNPSGTGPNSMGYDVGQYYDRRPLSLFEELFIRVRQWNKDIYNIHDKLGKINLNFIFSEPGRFVEFDRCGAFDSSRMQAHDCLTMTSVKQVFFDKAFMCRHMPHDMGDFYDSCGRFNKFDERNKTFDSGFIFDFDPYPVDKRMDEGWKFDETNGLFIPWFTGGDDPERVCTCDIANHSVKETPTEHILLDDSQTIKSIFDFNDSLKQNLDAFDSCWNFDGPLSAYFRDHLKQTIQVFFNDIIMDSIRGFDSGYTFDTYSTLLKDKLTNIITKNSEKDIYVATEKLSSSTSLSFTEVMETWATGFDVDFSFDTISSIIRDKLDYQFKLNFKENVSDNLSKFDSDYNFDIYSTLLRDSVQIIVRDL